MESATDNPLCKYSQYSLKEEGINLHINNAGNYVLISSIIFYLGRNLAGLQYGKTVKTVAVTLLTTINCVKESWDFSGFTSCITSVSPGPSSCKTDPSALALSV